MTCGAKWQAVPANTKVYYGRKSDDDAIMPILWDRSITNTENVNESLGHHLSFKKFQALCPDFTLE